MNLGDLFECLSFGELSNLSIGMEGAGTIADGQQSRIAHYTNQALTRIYNRFAHKRDYVTLVEVENQNLYTLPNDTLKILSASIPDPETGDPVDLKVNDSGDLSAIKIMGLNQIHIACPVADRVMTLERQVAPDKLVITAPVDLTQTIEIHPVLEEALTAKIAARVFGSMNGEENLIKAQSLEQQYEMICQSAEKEDVLQATVSNTHEKLIAGGWK
jgi:hypothetical protein